MSEIREGDNVKVTITGRAEDVGSDFVTVAYRDQTGTFLFSTVGTASAAVTVERVTPTILPGDVFEDKDGDLWHAVSDGRVACVADGTVGMVWEFDKARDQCDLTLVSRIRDTA